MKTVMERIMELEAKMAKSENEMKRCRYYAEFWKNRNSITENNFWDEYSQEEGNYQTLKREYDALITGMGTTN